MAEGRLLTAYRFRVTLHTTGKADEPLADGAFAECGGLDVEMDVSEYLEGGNNAEVIQRVGRAKYPRITLKRGMFAPTDGAASPALWVWIQEAVAGVRPLRRVDGQISVEDDGERSLALWRFHRGLPAKLSGPQLNAKTGEIAIESLEIAHQGLVLDVASRGAR